MTPPKSKSGADNAKTAPTTVSVSAPTGDQSTTGDTQAAGAGNDAATQPPSDAPTGEGSAAATTGETGDQAGAGDHGAADGSDQGTTLVTNLAGFDLQMNMPKTGEPIDIATAYPGALFGTLEEFKPNKVGILDEEEKEYATVTGGVMVDPHTQIKFTGVPEKSPMTSWLAMQIKADKIVERATEAKA